MFKLSRMKKTIISLTLSILLIGFSERSFAWGKKGHELVAEIAFHFLDDSTKKIVQQYLGKITIEEAATWMDENRSNSYYDFAKPWHYCDVEKGLDYIPSAEKNMITILFSAINELKNRDKMKLKDIKRDILVIFHLMGDLHQPLHCGYSSDKGGNSIDITSDVVSGNLHGVWDTQIIEARGIQLDDCLHFYDSLGYNKIDSIKKISVLSWYKQSRSYLDFVYSFKNNFLDKNYIDESEEIIKKQLLRGGLRLASVLKEVFNPAAKA